MAARQLSWPLYFTEVCFCHLYFQRLISEVSGRSSPNFATCSMVTIIYKTGPEIWWSPPQKKIWRPLNIKISAIFRTTSRLHRKYLRTGTRCRRSENGVANCDHFRARLLNSENFGSQKETRSSATAEKQRVSCPHGGG